MKDTSGGDIQVFRIIVLTAKELIDVAWYDAWLCSECKLALTIAALRRTDALAPPMPFKPEGSHVRIVCPHCEADRLYGINERQMVQWRAR